MMINRFKKSNVAIIGGGKFCKHLLETVFVTGSADPRHSLLGIAEIDPEAPGIRLARQWDVYTTTDYRNLFTLDGLDLIIDTTQNDLLGETVRKTKPAGVDFYDHFETRALLDYIKMERKKDAALDRIRTLPLKLGAIENELQDFWRYVLAIGRGRNTYYQQIRRDLIASERAMAQIVRGSTIPTFVINRSHIVTHWNKACEVLTGHEAKDIVGTNHQWKPFRDKARPTMADLILDGIVEIIAPKYYGTKWKQSSLIEGAYEAEEFFPHLGEGGKWLFFTGAPIRTQDGRIVGAIETLWDRTEDKRAEEEREIHNRVLAESERATAQIIQGSTVATFVVDRNHTITHWNKALENLTGCPAAKMVGTRKQWEPFYDFERPCMADVVLDQFDPAKIGALYNNWWPSPLIDGAYEAEELLPKLGVDGKWCFFAAAPILSPDGDIIGAVETLWDRTEYKKSEAERERYYTEIAGLCSIYTALNSSLDLDSRLKAAMDEIAEFLVAESTCIFLRRENNGFILKYSDTRSDSFCREILSTDETGIIHRVARGNEILIFENLPTTDRADIGLVGSEGLRSLAYVPISSKDNETLGVLRIGRKKNPYFSHEWKNLLELIGNRIGVAIENAMLYDRFIKSEEKYRSLFDNDPNPIFIMSTDSLKIEDVNERSKECYEYTRSELLGMSFYDLGDPADDELTQRLKTITAGQSILFARKRHYRKNRQPFYVNINVSRALSGDKPVLIATTTDISKTVEKETQLVQAGKMTTLGQMAAGIAHEINQPLNVIQVCADIFMKMMKKGQTISENDMRTLVDDINSNVQRAAGIIKHIRDFARQSEVIRNKISVNDPINDVFKVMGHQIKVHDVHLRLVLDPDIQPILAEHNRLEQVFINLVSNAIDALGEKAAADPEPGWLKQLTITSGMENRFVVVTVTDNGIGMSKDTMDKIFEPFFTTKEMGKGTGLGVSISYGIIKDYDGEIVLHSRPGKGTSFGLRFPAVTN